MKGCHGVTSFSYGSKYHLIRSVNHLRTGSIITIIDKLFVCLSTYQPHERSASHTLFSRNIPQKYMTEGWLVNHLDVQFGKLPLVIDGLIIWSGETPGFNLGGRAVWGQHRLEVEQPTLNSK